MCCDDRILVAARLLFWGSVEWGEQLERFTEHMRYCVAVLVLIKEENNADNCIHYLL